MKEKRERTIVVYIAPRQTGLPHLPDAHDDTTCSMKTSCVFSMGVYGYCRQPFGGILSFH